MLPDLSTWRIYNNGVLKFETRAVAMPTDKSKGQMFYFDVPSAKATFSMGEQILIALPLGTPTYLCTVLGIAEKKETPGTFQIQAAVNGANTAGIK
jgi:hypothetical protein